MMSSAERTSPKGYAMVLTLGAVLSVALSWLLWEQDVKNRVYPRNFGVVEQGMLYRCARLSEAQAEPTMRKYNIRTVVSLINDNDHPASAKPMAEAMEKLGIERHIFSMNGNGLSTPERYADAIEAIHRSHQAGKPVLVHCKAGAQRTGGVIATYELLVRGVSVEKAMQQLLAYGHDPDDNPKLLPWLNENLPTIAADLKQRGVIDRIPDPFPVLKP
jgi:protein tyrosine phosphatase (PTP) superfamily phosphohydrolase (DUF442 family)